MSRIDDLYARYLRRLIEMVERFSRRGDAADIAQETLIATWKNLDHVTPEGEWKYLRQAAQNLAKKRAARENVPRHGAGRLTPLEDEHDAHDKRPTVEAELVERAAIEDFRARFRAALEELSADTRLCVVLKRRGFNSKQIARHLNLSEVAVRSRLSRAAALLRDRLGPPPDVPWAELLGEENDDHEQ